jgi:hypothetical protein
VVNALPLFADTFCIAAPACRCGYSATGSSVHGFRFLGRLPFTAGEAVGASVEPAGAVPAGLGTGNANVGDGDTDDVTDTVDDGDGVTLGEGKGLGVGLGVGGGGMIFSQ